MSSHRLAQLNELLRERLAEAFTRELELPAGVMVTVKRVDISADLHHAMVWLSILPTPQATATLKYIVTQIPEIQHVIAGQVEFQFMPKLHVRLDDSEERAQHITDILDELQRGGDTSN